MGYKIREVRLSKNMTQEELAKKSGVSRVIISGLECGSRKETTTKTLLALASALETSVDALFFNPDV